MHKLCLLSDYFKSINFEKQSYNLLMNACSFQLRMKIRFCKQLLTICMIVLSKGLAKFCFQRNIW